MTSKSTESNEKTAKDKLGEMVTPRTTIIYPEIEKAERVSGAIGSLCVSVIIILLGCVLLSFSPGWEEMNALRYFADTWLTPIILTMVLIIAHRILKLQIFRMTRGLERRE